MRSDVIVRIERHGQRRFNPRSPHEERLQTLERMITRALFQSTLPA